MTPLTEPVGLSMTREDTSPGQSFRFEKTRVPLRKLTEAIGAFLRSKNKTGARVTVWASRSSGVSILMANRMVVCQTVLNCSSVQVRLVRKVKLMRRAKFMDS